MKTTKQIVRVTAGVITKNGKVLLCRRRPGSGPLGGKWEFPGGKIEKGEKASDCLVREIKEELGVDIKDLRYIGRTDHHYPHISIRLLFYLANYIGGRMVMTDHDRIAWVRPVQIACYDLAPADAVFLPQLLNSGF